MNRIIRILNSKYIIPFTLTGLALHYFFVFKPQEREVDKLCYKAKEKLDKDLKTGKITQETYNIQLKALFPNKNN